MQTQNTSVVASNNTNTTPSTTGNILNELKPGMVISTPFGGKPERGCLYFHPHFKTSPVVYITRSLEAGKENQLVISTWHGKNNGAVCFIQDKGLQEAMLEKEIEVLVGAIQIIHVNNKSVTATIVSYQNLLLTQPEKQIKLDGVSLKKGTRIYRPAYNPQGHSPEVRETNFCLNDTENAWVFKANLGMNTSFPTRDKDTFVAIDPEEKGVICFFNEKKIPDNWNCFEVTGISKNGNCVFVKLANVPQEEHLGMFEVPYSEIIDLYEQRELEEISGAAA